MHHVGTRSWRAFAASTPDDAGSGAADIVEQTSGLTAGDWIQAGIVVGTAIVLAVFAAGLTRRLVSQYNEMIATLLGRIVGGVFVVIGFVYGLNSVGVAIGPVLGGLGIGGVAIAFAMKDILGNILAGVVIQIRRPFEIGHLVKLDGRLGRVTAVTLRTVEIDAVDGERVILPASQVLNNAIENWSTNGRRRADVVIGIPYEADIELVKERLFDAMREVDGALPHQDPMVLVHEFGGSSVDIRLLVWHDVEDVHFLEFASRVAAAAKACVNDAGYSVPFPIRTLEFADGTPLERIAAGLSAREHRRDDR